MADLTVWGPPFPPHHTHAHAHTLPTRYVLISTGCGSTDKYGSNDCNFHWGQSISITVNLTLGQDIVQGDTFALDLNFDKVVPLKTECALCGAECSIEIPVIHVSVCVCVCVCVCAMAL